MDIEKELRKLRKELEREFKCYPDNCCTETSRRGEKLGLEMVYGLFVDDEGFGYNHCWLKNKNGNMIYDITADQFGGNFPPVIILRANSEEAGKRYIEGAFYMF